MLCPLHKGPEGGEETNPGVVSTPQGTGGEEINPGVVSTLQGNGGGGD